MVFPACVKQKMPYIQRNLPPNTKALTPLYSFFPNTLCTRETTVSTAVSPMIVIDQATPTCR